MDKKSSSQIENNLLRSKLCFCCFIFSLLLLLFLGHFSRSNMPFVAQRFLLCASHGELRRLNYGRRSMAIERPNRMTNWPNKRMNVCHSKWRSSENKIDHNDHKTESQRSNYNRKIIRVNRTERPCERATRQAKKVERKWWKPFATFILECDGVQFYYVTSWYH